MTPKEQAAGEGGVPTGGQAPLSAPPFHPPSIPPKDTVLHSGNAISGSWCPWTDQLSLNSVDRRNDHFSNCKALDFPRAAQDLIMRRDPLPIEPAGTILVPGEAWKFSRCGEVFFAQGKEDECGATKRDFNRASAGAPHDV